MLASGNNCAASITLDVLLIAVRGTLLTYLLLLLYLLSSCVLCPADVWVLCLCCCWLVLCRQHCIVCAGLTPGCSTVCTNSGKTAGLLHAQLRSHVRIAMAQCSAEAFASGAQLLRALPAGCVCVGCTTAAAPQYPGLSGMCSKQQVAYH
jgi:hypothetical protein